MGGEEGMGRPGDPIGGLCVCVRERVSDIIYHIGETRRPHRTSQRGILLSLSTRDLHCHQSRP
jgi:hypothetical protein